MIRKFIVRSDSLLLFDITVLLITSSILRKIINTSTLINILIFDHDVLSITVHEFIHSSSGNAPDSYVSVLTPSIENLKGRLQYIIRFVP